MPILPNMNTFIELRQEDNYKKIFHESTGLISQVEATPWYKVHDSQGEAWFKFRQAVQKEMMCPSGALRYVNDIEDIALDLTEVIISLNFKCS